MKLNTTASIALLSLGAACAANATLVAWQTQVGTGATASTTQFTTVSSPTTIDVGALTGARSFEFIVNSGAAGSSQSLIGDRTAAGSGGSNQALKFEQYNNTGNYGVSAFGVTDWNSGVSNTTDTDLHVVFTTNGTSTQIWINGTSVATNATLNLTGTGITGLGGTWRGGTTFNDQLDGDILGFASYDSELSEAEIQAHSNAFFAPIPEPSSTALLGLGGLALILRRRK